ncbi:transcription termination factor NusG [Alphaproteobacteria bacterium]
MSSDVSKWYIINTMVGYENKVVRLIRGDIVKKGLDSLVQQVIVPAKSVQEVRKGKKVQAEKKIFPGYVLIKMILNDTTWGLVKGTQHVAKFLGMGNKPGEVSGREVEHILQYIEDAKLSPEEDTELYEVGELVKIIDGPFDGFSAVVEDIEREKQRLKVSVSIFGRETPVDLDFQQVQKIKRD